MSVTDVRGQLIHTEEIGMHENFRSFDASSLQKGVYIMHFVSDEMNVNRKIIVH